MTTGRISNSPSVPNSYLVKTRGSRQSSLWIRLAYVGNIHIFTTSRSNTPTLTYILHLGFCLESDTGVLLVLLAQANQQSYPSVSDCAIQYLNCYHGGGVQQVVHWVTWVVVSVHSGYGVHPRPSTPTYVSLLQYFFSQKRARIYMLPENGGRSVLRIISGSGRSMKANDDGVRLFRRV